MSRLEAALQVAAVKKLAGERAGLILDEKVINGVAAPHAAHGLAAHDTRADGVRAIWLDVTDIRKAGAVFVTKRQVGKQIFESVDAPLRQQLRALRADALDHANFRGETEGHSKK